MIGSLLTRGLVMVLGYAYPAYECYKSVELNKPDIEQLRFWCQYWVLVAGLTVFERFGDTLVGWVPMYGEAKLAFFVYLWYPKTKGTTYVYGSFFRPYIAKHETEIDRNLLELKTRAGDLALIYWQKTASYAQTRVLDILQFIAAQSTPKREAKPQQKETKVESTLQPQDEGPSSPALSISSSEPEEEDAEEEVAGPSVDPKAAGPSVDPKAAAPAPALLKEQKMIQNRDVVTSTSSKEEVMQMNSVNETTSPLVQETVRRLTRAKSTKKGVA